MTAITGVVLDDNQRPAAAVYVSAELVASSRWLADRSGLVEGREDAYSGTDGRWELVLPPRSVMLDEDAWWRVRVWGYGAFGVIVPDDPGHPVEAAADGVLRPPGDDDPPPPLGRPDTPTGVPLVYVRDPATGEYALVPYTDGPPPGAVALDDLSDVSTDGAMTGQVLVRGPDGVWYPDNPTSGGAQWGDAVAFSATEPDPDTAPASAVWVELGPDLRIYRKAP